MTRPSVLTIAGSDSSGGAGIQADLKTIAAYECYGTSAITALTAQNTVGVKGVHPTPPEFLAMQIESVVNDIDIQSIKTGMLFSAAHIRAVVKALKMHYGALSSIPPLVCDPVSVATSGDRLLQPEAIQTMVSDLFPISKLVTPNKSEAELLLKHGQLPSRIENLEDMVAAARNLFSLGPYSVLVKGGHIIASPDDVSRLVEAHPEIAVVSYGLLSENMEILKVDNDDSPPKLVVDVLFESKKEITVFVRPRIETSSTHGTGCTLSAAIASELACGLTLKNAVEAAVQYVHQSIQSAYPIGHGHGPLNHLQGMALRVFPHATKTMPYPFTQLLIQGNAADWKKYVQHRFVVSLGKGKLPREAFVHFIVQDYKYLQYYARAYGLLAAKSTSYKSIKDAAKNIVGTIREADTEKDFYASFGVTEELLVNSPEALATTAYGAFMIDMALQGDATKLLMSLLACLIGYGEVGLWLKKESQREGSGILIEDNPYKRWIEVYSGKKYQDAVKRGLGVIEAQAAVDCASRERFEEYAAVWKRCTKFEIGFWDAAMTAADESGGRQDS